MLIQRTKNGSCPHYFYLECMSSEMLVTPLFPWDFYDPGNTYNLSSNGSGDGYGLTTTITSYLYSVLLSAYPNKTPSPPQKFKYQSPSKWIRRLPPKQQQLWNNAVERGIGDIPGVKTAPSNVEGSCWRLIGQIGQTLQKYIGGCMLIVPGVLVQPYFDMFFSQPYDPYKNQVID
jgi:hypothetical protein